MSSPFSSKPETTTTTPMNPAIVPYAVSIFATAIDNWKLGLPGFILAEHILKLEHAVSAVNLSLPINNSITAIARTTTPIIIIPLRKKDFYGRKSAFAL